MLSNKFVKALELAFKNCDRIPADELAQTIKPHISEILDKAYEQELQEDCFAELG